MTALFVLLLIFPPGPAAAAAAAASAATFDCGLRQLMLAYAARAQPWRSGADFAAMADSLAAASAVMPANNGSRCALVPPPGGAPSPPPSPPPADAFFVSPGGDDGADGSRTAPFATVARALAAARSVPPGAPRAIELLAGTHFLNGSLLALDARDSGLRVASAAGAAVSGGTPLAGLIWARSPAGGGRVWAAALPPSLAASLPRVLGLRDARSGRRLPRARYPNVGDIDAESILDTGVMAEAWQPGAHVGPTRVLYPPYPYRDDILLMQHYTVGLGAFGCRNFVPPFGFWCSNLTSREANGTGFLSYPASVLLNASQLPHLPYANATGGVLHSWHSGRWFSVQFLLDAALTAWDPSARTANFSFAAGGWQGSRGCKYCPTATTVPVRTALTLSTPLPTATT